MRPAGRAQRAGEGGCTPSSPAEEEVNALPGVSQSPLNPGCSTLRPPYLVLPNSTKHPFHTNKLGGACPSGRPLSRGQARCKQAYKQARERASERGRRPGRAQCAGEQGPLPCPSSPAEEEEGRQAGRQTDRQTNRERERECALGRLSSSEGGHACKRERERVCVREPRVSLIETADANIQAARS